MRGTTRARVLEYVLRHDRSRAAAIAASCQTHKRYVRELARDGFLRRVNVGPREVVYSVTRDGLYWLDAWEARWRASKPRAVLMFGKEATR